MSENYEALFCRIREKCQRQGWWGADGDNRLSNLPGESNFAFPPATAEQIAATEQWLGFRLSPLLRELYMNVANGGFGPAYGLKGVIGGYHEISYTGVRWDRYVDFEWYERRQAGKKLIRMPFYVYPYGFFRLCDRGCTIFSYLDCETDRVYRGACYGIDCEGYELECNSFYEWLDLWVNDELEL